MMDSAWHYEWGRGQFSLIFLATVFSIVIFATISLEALQTNFNKVTNPGPAGIDYDVELRKRGLRGHARKGPKGPQEFANTTSSKSGVQINVQDQHIVLDNGLIQLTLSNPDGLVTGIKFNGIENLLSVHDAEDSRGYWDVVWGDAGAMDKLKTTEFKIIVQNENQAEISFTRKWDPSQQGKFPVNIDKRYIVLKGSSGFYTYVILDHLKGWPAFTIGEARIAFKLDDEKFQHMTVSDTRRRVMPTFEDRKNGQPLAYPEAVLLTNPANPALKGEVDDKYQYSMDNKDKSGSRLDLPKSADWIVDDNNK